MTNHDLAQSAAEKIERSCGTTDDVFDGYVQETTQIIADTYAAPMAKLERLKRQVAFVKRESLVAVANSRGEHYETRCLICKNFWHVSAKPHHSKDCPHNEVAT